jgi:uncharacterized protein YjbI with pentapeptide repeats
VGSDSANVDALQKAQNDIGGRVSAMWTTFTLFELYLIITYSSVKHRDLFLESPARLPLLNVDLPLLGFFAISAIIFVIFHLYVLLQVLSFTEAAKLFETEVCHTIKLKADRERILRLGDKFLLSNLRSRYSTDEHKLADAIWRFIPLVTLIVVPLVTLLQAQIVFIPYHSELVTWVHRVCVAADLILLFYFWPRFWSARIERRGARRQFTAYLPYAAACAVLFFSLVVASFPSERIIGLLPNVHIIPTTLKPEWSSSADWSSPHKILFQGKPNRATGTSSSVFSSYLILSDQTFVDPDKLPQIRISRSFRGRDLRDAILDRSDLRKADFSAANLDGASLSGTLLQDAKFSCAETISGYECSSFRRAYMVFAQLQGAEMRNPDFEGARLDGANLQGADAPYMRLRRADLAGANLRGANLTGAQFQGANLYKSQVQAANLHYANFNLAELSEADLAGAKLGEVSFVGASLANTNLNGAGLGRIFAWRARGNPTLKLADADAVFFDQPLDIRNSDEYKRWLHETVPGASLNDISFLSIRMAALDPSRPDPSDMITASAWNNFLLTQKEPQRRKELADYLAALACSSFGAPYIAIGLLQSGRLAELGTDVSVVAARMRGGRFGDHAKCPGVALFRDSDWGELDKLTPAP